MEQKSLCCSSKDSEAGVAAAAAAGRVDLRKTGGTPWVRNRLAGSPGTFPLRQNFGLREVGAGKKAGAPRQCPASRRLRADLGSTSPAGARLRLQLAPLGTQAATPKKGREPGRGLEQPQENNNRALTPVAALGQRGSPKFHRGESHCHMTKALPQFIFLPVYFPFAFLETESHFMALGGVPWPHAAHSSLQLLGLSDCLASAS
ncbi:uncharacterized protein LOC128579042 [Nycticebus coucang]|uniref:uncharacterized protein LOC128579042 n=1 Tax=Nycticebus coucang TaxID=9470 RepID=UPI00234C708A|nr:uncharacterized protein LOC128579042 [Nycticebus coucang]